MDANINVNELVEKVENLLGLKNPLIDENKYTDNSGGMCIGCGGCTGCQGNCAGTCNTSCDAQQ